MVEQPIPGCNVVIFGATGDLTHRKLMPALFSLDAEALLPPTLHIVGYARREHSDDSYREEIKSALQQFSPDLWKKASGCWERFSRRILYHRDNFENVQGFTQLKKHLDEMDKKEGTGGNRLLYLATPPDIYPELISQFNSSGLTKSQQPEGQPKPFVRVVVEKPFGSDLESAQALNKELKSVFDESQIYRIDHYLGKETVQNIFVFRFANAIFEPIWNGKYVNNIQITVAETVGWKTGPDISITRANCETWCRATPCSF